LNWSKEEIWIFFNGGDLRRMMDLSEVNKCFWRFKWEGFHIGGNFLFYDNIKVDHPIITHSINSEK